MLLPLGLIMVGMLAAAVVAYGTHAAWGHYAHGLELILLARQLQWPLVIVSLAAAIALLLVVISGKRRAWWLIGLAPILALFIQRFAMSPVNAMVVLENPRFLAAANVEFLSDEDFVVGLTFGDTSYAFPFSSLYAAPVVVQSDRDKRFILMWSALANRAVAYEISREIKPRELEIVSTPANALLIYNSRFGQFINGVTGQTIKASEKPIGFASPLVTSKMPWPRWRQLHPDTQVMSFRASPTAPRGPVLPTFPKSTAESPVREDARIIVVGLSEPVAVLADDLKSDPLNLTADGIPVLLFRDPISGEAKAFDRRIEDDLSPRFELNKDARRPLARLIDLDTGCGWNASGVAVDGEKSIRGRQLRSIPVEEGLYWGVMKHWYPRLHPPADAI